MLHNKRAAATALVFNAEDIYDVFGFGQFCNHSQPSCDVREILFTDDVGDQHHLCSYVRLL